MTISSLSSSAALAQHPANQYAPADTANAVVDGMRGLAVLLIVLTHYLPPEFFSFNLAKPLSTFLFVAAGYFWTSHLTRSVGLKSDSLTVRAKAMWKIQLRRQVRIWPVMAFVIGLYVLLGWLDRGPLTTQIFETWPLYLIYLGNVPKWLFEAHAFPAHFWLISSQEQLLLVCSLLIIFFGFPCFRSWLPAILIIGLVSRFAGAWVFMPAQPALALETPLAVADGLAIGAMARIAVEESFQRSAIRRFLLTVMILSAVTWLLLPNFNPVYFALAPFILGITGGLAVVIATDPLQERRLQNSPLTWPPLVFVGRISLSLFLIHPLLNTVIVLIYPKIFGELMPWQLVAVVGAPMAILGAIAMFYAIERPIQNARNKALKRDTVSI